jgi:putative ATP-dependent endonuclease of OLD family
MEGEDELPATPDLKALESDYVRVFSCATTLERAVTLGGTLEMLAHAADDIGAPAVASRLRGGIVALADAGEASERRDILMPLRGAVLNTARRFGKARFAQIASRYVSFATSMPKYIADAAEWLAQP